MSLSWDDIAKRNNSDLNDPNEFYKLDQAIQKRLLDWIESNLSERTSYNRTITSYGLKHMLPFYVTNGAFKGAMLESGFKVANKDEMNWYFNVYVRKER